MRQGVIRRQRVAGHTLVQAQEHPVVAACPSVVPGTHIAVDRASEGTCWIEQGERAARVQIGSRRAKGVGINSYRSAPAIDGCEAVPIGIPDSGNIDTWVQFAAAVEMRQLVPDIGGRY